MGSPADPHPAECTDSWQLDDRRRTRRRHTRALCEQRLNVGGKGVREIFEMLGISVCSIGVDLGSDTHEAATQPRHSDPTSPSLDIADVIGDELFDVAQRPVHGHCNGQEASLRIFEAVELTRRLKSSTERRVIELVGVE